MTSTTLTKTTVLESPAHIFGACYCMQSRVTLKKDEETSKWVVEQIENISADDALEVRSKDISFYSKSLCPIIGGVIGFIGGPIGACIGAIIGIAVAILITKAGKSMLKSYKEKHPDFGLSLSHLRERDEVIENLLKAANDDDSFEFQPKYTLTMY